MYEYIIKIMRAFTERQALSAVAEEVINDDSEDDQVKGYLDRTLRTGQRFSQFIVN